MSARSEPRHEDLVANVRRTTETAVQVLRHFAHTLDQAGFRAGAESYEQLALTLAGQRLWTAQHGDEAIERNFDQLAGAAAEVRRTLVPYVRVMERLSALGTPAPADRESGTASDGSAGLDSLERGVLDALRQTAEACSATRLRTATGLSASSLRAALDRLVEQELVTVIQRGSRQMYRAAK